MAALAPFYPVPCDRAMFKYLFRVRIGGWWLLAGVWLKWRVSPFRFRSMWWAYREYTLRVLWFEISLSELPF